MTGEVLWSQHYASTSGTDEGFLGMALDSNDDVYLAGREMVGAEQDQAMAMKLSGSNGNVIWSKYLGGSASDKDIAWDIVVGSDDNPVISGFVVNNGSVAEYFVRKMNNANGNLIWDKRGPQAQNNFGSRGTWLELMDNDDVVMCQRTFGSNGYDVYLKRFRTSNGSTAWETTYDGDTHGGDDPRAMIRAANGDLLIAGVQDVLWNYNFMALRVDGDTGDVKWVSNYDGPPGWYDVGTAVAEDPSGNVLVAGYSDGTGTSWDWATVAFDGTNGDQMWVQRFDGPTSQSDEPNHLVAAPGGEIFVTGYGYGDGSNKDMFTVCYKADDTSAAGDLPQAASLNQAWPNPFNPRVNFSFSLPGEAHARLAVYDLKGRLVTTLVDRSLPSGEHSASWNGVDAAGRTAPAGVYLAIMESGDIRQTRKIILAK